MQAMARDRDFSEGQIAFHVEGVPEGEIQVIRYRGTEGLNQLYRFEIELAVGQGDLLLNDLVGKAAVLSINSAQGETWFHGILARFELTGEVRGVLTYRADLVPSLWLLTHRYHSRIFQDKNVKQIITQVLTDAGMAADRFNMDGLPDSQFENHENCVQYRETDFNFISRLCEEEGIWYYFQQSQEGHVLKFCAGPGFAVPIAGDPALPFVEPSGLNTLDQDHVFSLRRSQSVRPDKVVLKSFNFENPGLGLEATHDAFSRNAGLTFSDSPGQYVDQAKGSSEAERVNQEIEASRVTAIGQSNCVRLGPGKTFELKEHTSAQCNGKYFLTSVTHQGEQATAFSSTASGVSSLLRSESNGALRAALGHSDPVIRTVANSLLEIAERLQARDPTANRAMTHWMYHAGQVAQDIQSTAQAMGINPLDMLALPNLIADVARLNVVNYSGPLYMCRFECIPDGVTYRPPRLTAWPDMRGCQTARVVGPPGEEIYTDKYGRVKVQFHWDREGKFDDKSSCWMRVAQGSAGGQYGMMFIPRIGWEVVVQFLEGNPDDPIVVGCVYNADHMPPYELPAQKTKSVIKTNSSKGGGGTNEICFEDDKGKEEILIYAEKDLCLRAKSNHVENIGNEYHLTIEKKKYELVKQETHLEVKLDVNEKIGGKKLTKVEGDVSAEIAGKHTENVTGDFYLKSDGKIVIEAGSEITLKVGGNFIKIDSGGVTEMGTQIKLNSGGSAGSGSMVALNEVKPTIAARTAKPGKDKNYSGGAAMQPGAIGPDAAGYKWTPEEKEQKESSWIEIEMVDEEGQPWPGEEYELTLPDGSIKRGNLNSKGLAHVYLPEKGECQIGFPNLDRRAWERCAGGGPPGGGTPPGGGGGYTPPPPGGYEPPAPPPSPPYNPPPKPPYQPPEEPPYRPPYEEPKEPPYQPPPPEEPGEPPYSPPPGEPDEPYHPPPEEPEKPPYKPPPPKPPAPPPEEPYTPPGGGY